MENNNSTPKSNKNDDNLTTQSKIELNPSSTSNDIINNNNINNDLTVVSNGGAQPQDGAAAAAARRSRRPFTDLSQEDADLALARTLQEQERAYMMLTMSADGIPYGSWGAAGYVHEDDEDDDFNDPSEDEYDGSDVDDDEDEDAFDVHAHIESGEGGHQGAALDPSAYPNDEAYARALQDAEERVMASRLLALAGINDVFIGDAENIDEDDDNEDDDADENDDDEGQNSQDAWEEVDPDELSYEELIALGEVVGTQSRGLPAETIASLPSVNFKSENTQEGSSDPCVICRCDYEDGETLTVLPCNHSYHSECVNNWLCQNKVCPICNAEVSTPGNS